MDLLRWLLDARVPAGSALLPDEAPGRNSFFSGPAGLSGRDGAAQ
ncbi:hypothetical protein [Arthrobacter mobilis]|nr:hypothetical protein [Arthrobacter mobilis]